MKIRSFRDLLNGVFRVSVRTEDWSQDDNRLMAQYGEPEIDVGGVFDLGEGADFELPSKLVRIASECPLIFVAVDRRDHEDARDRALAWETRIVSDITDAVALLRDHGPDTYSAETVENVNAAGAFNSENVVSV